jgi:hypothetical protein
MKILQEMNEFGEQTAGQDYSGGLFEDQFVVGIHP